MVSFQWWAYTYIKIWTRRITPLASYLTLMRAQVSPSDRPEVQISWILEPPIAGRWEWAIFGFKRSIKWHFSQNISQDRGPIGSEFDTTESRLGWGIACIAIKYSNSFQEITKQPVRLVSPWTYPQSCISLPRCCILIPSAVAGVNICVVPWAVDGNGRFRKILA